jgi:hypothetical protein
MAFSRKERVEIERDYIHPVVSTWLAENGFEYLHETNIRDIDPESNSTKKPDFFAVHNTTGVSFVVECKKSRMNTWQAIYQIGRYSKAFRSFQPLYCLALPQNEITQRVKEICQANGVSLLPVDVDVREL